MPPWEEISIRYIRSALSDHPTAFHFLIGIDFPIDIQKIILYFFLLYIEFFDFGDELDSTGAVRLENACPGPGSWLNLWDPN